MKKEKAMTSTDPEPTAEDLAVALMIVLYELHPVYGNTSRRGRGIGGQAMTQQCNVIDPEGWEFEAKEWADEVLRGYTRTREFSERYQEALAKIKDRVR